MSHHLIEVIDLHYAYPDNTPALRGISFLATHGESVAIIGSNGAGKSTLLMHLNGSLVPASGEVRIGEIPVIPSTLTDIRKTVGMVFQNPDDQLFMPRVYDDVAFGPINLGLPPNEVEKRTLKALEDVCCLHLRDKAPYRLSGGEKRAVSIATVLSMTPDILVMDEPSSNLDPKSRRSLIYLLNQFTHTKIIATHDLPLVRDTCSRTIILHRGAIVADGTTEKLLNDKDLLESCDLEMCP